VPPAPDPTGLKATGVQGGVQLSWQDNSLNETSWIISDGVTNKYQNVSNGGTTGTVTYTWTGMGSHEWKCFHVRAYNSWGTSGYAPSSGYVCAYSATLPGVPAGNSIWNGYVTGGTRATDVIATWTVPSVQGCGTPGSAGSSEWIGLGGVNTPLVQIGTRDLCGALPNPAAVWEVVPEQSNPQVIIGCGLECGHVTPGDLIDAEVKYVGGNQYFISITDNAWSWTWSQTVTQPASSATPQTAEWIVEGPSGMPLSNFGTAQFTNCFWNSGAGLSPLTSATVFEAADSSGLQTSVSAISQYGGHGPNFTVTWLRS
jgi:hypothetical protein